jgi:hypothetical protein
LTERQTRVDMEIETGKRRRIGTRRHQADFPEVLAHNL